LAEIPMKPTYPLLQLRYELVLADLFEKGGKSDRESKGKGHQVKGKIVKNGDEETPVIPFT